jgi:transcriptional regulator with XRE-family HTH domain
MKDNSEKDNIPISQQVRLIRKEKGLSQKTLAERLGTSQKAITRFEKEEVKPNLRSLEKMADALDCSLEVNLVRKKVVKDVGLLQNPGIKKRFTNKKVGSGQNIRRDISDIKMQILAKLKNSIKS